MSRTGLGVSSRPQVLGLSACKHGEAVRTGNSDFVGSSLVELFETQNVDARGLVHEDLGAARAATHGVASRVFRDP